MRDDLQEDKLSHNQHLMKLPEQSQPETALVILFPRFG